MARGGRRSSSRTRSGGGTTAIVIAAPRGPAYMTPQREGPMVVSRRRQLVARLGGNYVKRRGGIIPTGKRVLGLSVGGALGSAVQGTVQGLGLSPVWSKVLVIGGGIVLGSGAAPGSMTEAGSDGMIASAGAGAIFDIIAAWQRARAQAQQPPAQQPNNKGATP